jgi:diacylglycerol kinase family enzyme
MKLFFVLNPISGGINKEPFLMEAFSLCDQKNIEYAIFRTSGKDDLKKLKAEIDEFKPDKVASVGGDGTTLFTGIALLESGIPMGIVPMGSANGMAQELTINTHSPIAALQSLIRSNHIKDLDLIRVNDEYYCLHIGDVGINAQIVDKYSKDPKRGMMTYAKYFREAVLEQNHFDYEIAYNGEIRKGNTLMIAICNARKFGTGVPLNRTGSPFDGKMELVLINEVSRMGLLKAGLSIFDEDFMNTDHQHVITCEEATIHFPEKRLLQLDGEVIGKMDTINLKILKGAIKFIAAQ